MATIKKREGKKGTSYLIRSSCGYTADGRQMEQAREQLKVGDYWKGTGRLFTALDGSPMHPATPYSWLRKFCRETGQRFLGVHQFRHLNASLLINSGADVKTVSSSLGHSNVTTTLNIYSHTFEEAQAKAADAVADLLTHKMA